MHTLTRHTCCVPYEDERLSMLVMLPDNTSDISNLEKSTSEEHILWWVDNLEMHDVNV